MLKESLIAYILIALWGSQLVNSDAYYANYLLIVLVACICCYINSGMDNSLLHSHRTERTVLMVFSALFSCMIALSNCKTWAYAEVPDGFGRRFGTAYHTFLAIIVFAGGFLAFWSIGCSLYSKMAALLWKSRDGAERSRPGAVFGVSFMLIVLTRWIVLYFCQYPGVLTVDSISQVSQLLSGIYSNHHPFYHTMIVKLFVNFGSGVFGDISAGVATYHVFQILFTAMCFSFALSTMERMRTPRWIIVATMLFFTLMPYHILYAITMWKDVIFGCCVLLFVVFVFRCMHGIGKGRREEVFDHSMLVAAGIGICLFRSNGFFAFVLLTFVFLALWKQTYGKMLMIFVSVVVVSCIMKHPLLSVMGVEQPDIIESLSIPAQQIARVVVEGHELSEWEFATLEKIIDIDQIPGKYKDYISDPIKGLVREKDNQEMIIKEKSEYLRLYCSLGLRYPKTYICAWIEQTRGYWNAGYEYWRWRFGVEENDLDIETLTRSHALNRKLQEYAWLFTDVHGLRLFLSIGLFVWLDILMLMISVLRKDKLGVFISLPIIAVVTSLLVSTPVFSEFRYMYAAFCTLPMVIVVALRPAVDSKDAMSVHISSSGR